MAKCDVCGKECKNVGSHKNKAHKPLTTDQIREAAQGIEVKDLDSVKALGRVKEPSLGDPNYDPFKQFKTEEDKYYYRALNVRPHNLRMREAQGFKTIPGTEYGDLVLGKMPRHIKESLDAKERKKATEMLAAPKNEFKQKAEDAGLKTFEETD